MRCFLVLSFVAVAVLASPATQTPEGGEVRAQTQASEPASVKAPAAAVVVPESDVEIDDTLQGKHSVLFAYARSRPDTVVTAVNHSITFL